jgi:hypothetical protein
VSANAVSLFVARASAEEGERLLPYDDATGRLVAAPQGNLSWGWGFNLMQCGSHGLFVVMCTYLATQVDALLSEHTWYQQAGDVRQSVFLDVAYNEGVNGLVNGFPKMIAAAALGNWTEASAQCSIANASEDASRYAPLRALLLNNGVT